MHTYNVNNQYRRRHLFFIGFFVYQALVVGVFHGVVSPIFDKVILTVSFCALFVIFHALLREREEVAFQRRWYFFLGVGVSTLMNLYRAQRFGLFLHGSSYYLEHAPQLKLSRRFRNILFTRNKHLSEEGLTKSLLPPTELFYNVDKMIEDVAKEPEKVLDEIDKVFVKHSSDSENHMLGPAALYANSIVTPFVDLRKSISDVMPFGQRATSDIVLIVFNGVLAEFIENGPFQSIFDGKSNFKNEWKDVMDRLRRSEDEDDKKLTNDSIWSLEKLGPRPHGYGHAIQCRKRR